MSLDTVLKIGKALRSSKDNLKYFKYVSQCPKDKDGNYPFCISIPVQSDFVIDWNDLKEVPENQRDSLRYLRFKTSDSDGLMKYIYGDIYYLRKSTINKKDNSVTTSEAGGYRLADPDHNNAAYRPSSFNRGNADYEEILKNEQNQSESFLFRFRNSLDKDLSILETILDNIQAVEYFLRNPTERQFLAFLDDEKAIEDFTIKQVLESTGKATLKKLGVETDYENLNEEQRSKLLEYDNGEIFIHFEFPENKSWYDYPEDFELIKKKMFSDFVDKTAEGLVLKKTLYKTLCSGDKKNDIQFPGFDLESKHKSRFFTDESIDDLFYAIDYSKKGKLIPWTDIKIIILPRGENLNADDYMAFQSKGDEESINQANENDGDNNEPLFDIFDDDNGEVTSFDVVFSKKGGTTSPDVDLSEISGLEKSNIRCTKRRIAEIANEIYQKRKSYFVNTTKDFRSFKLSSSFRNILGTPQSDSKIGKISFKAGKTYQSHMLKVLPLIYTDSYYQDGRLMSEFIENIEYSVRAGDSQFNFLKFDLEFLISIQNNKNNRFMDIINSNSYQVGLLLGSLAKNFAGEKSPIKSFEKNYVGNLSRRISTIEDFIKLKNDIEQKLIMHEKTKFTYQTSYELSTKLKDFVGIYDKEEAAFGFFESYFKPIANSGNTTKEQEQ